MKRRRTCATMALKRGMPVEQVSKMLGHEELTTTQIYLDLDERNLEIAHEKYVV
jgi:phage integrase